VLGVARTAVRTRLLSAKSASVWGKHSSDVRRKFSTGTDQTGTFTTLVINIYIYLYQYISCNILFAGGHLSYHFITSCLIQEERRSPFQRRHRLTLSHYLLQQLVFGSLLRPIAHNIAFLVNCHSQRSGSSTNPSRDVLDSLQPWRPSTGFYIQSTTHRL
jgi:hypothetical protein